MASRAPRRASRPRDSTTRFGPPGRARGLDHQRLGVVGGVPAREQREDLGRVPRRHAGAGSRADRPSGSARVGGHAHACLNPGRGQPQRSGSPGARPRTLPAAVSPVLAGTGVAAYVDQAVWWKALLALVVSAGPAGRGQLRQRLLRRHPRHRRRPGRPAAAGRLGPRHARARSSARRSLASASPAVAGLVLAATTAWWLVAVGAAVRAGRLVLHRRLPALRLPRAG